MPPRLSPAAADELRTYRVPDEVLHALDHFVLPVVYDVCERAGMDYDEDLGDDPNLYGQQCSRRSRNLIARQIEDATLEGIRVSRPRNTMVVLAGGVRLHVWAAGDEAGAPRLRGGRTKPEILDRCLEQLPLWRDERMKPPADLVVAYRTTPGARCLKKVVVGVPRSEDAWEFGVAVYDRKVPAAKLQPKPALPERYDAQKPAAPVIELRPRSERKPTGQQ